MQMLLRHDVLRHDARRSRCALALITRSRARICRLETVRKDVVAPVLSRFLPH